MKSPVVTAMAGRLLFLVLTIVSTLIAKLGIGMSLSVLDATNGKSVLFEIIAVPSYSHAVFDGASVPRPRFTGRGTPPVTARPSIDEITRGR